VCWRACAVVNSDRSKLADILFLDARRPSPPAGNGALQLVRQYFTTINPARGHGKTDCGEMLDGSGSLPDGDHFLAWLAAEGFMVVPT
jgi:hypothetical protein